MHNNPHKLNIIDKITKLCELKNNQFHLAEQCFPSNYPNITFVKSVLENKINGSVYIDSMINPQLAFVLTTGPFGFVSPRFNFESLKLVYNAFKNKTDQIKDYKLVFDSSVINHQFNTCDHSVIKRLHFNINKQKVINKEPLCPKGITLHRIDTLLFDKCNWKELMLSFYGTKEKYLKNSTGFCLLKDNQIVSEAHAIISNNYAELGVITAPNFRNHGLSSIVCNVLVSYCLNLGVSPKWSCNAVNEISHKLALQLGFDDLLLYNALI